MDSECISVMAHTCVKICKAFVDIYTIPRLRQARSNIRTRYIFIDFDRTQTIPANDKSVLRCVDVLRTNTKLRDLATEHQRSYFDLVLADPRGEFRGVMRKQAPGGYQRLVPCTVMSSVTGGTVDLTYEPGFWEFWTPKAHAAQFEEVFNS